MCACVEADMDFSDGEIRIFGTRLDFSIGEILTVTQMQISPLDKSIFVAPVWISPMENPEWCQTHGFIHQGNPYLPPHMQKIG